MGSVGVCAWFMLNSGRRLFEAGIMFVSYALAGHVEQHHAVFG